jgi:hypothetical protein
MAQRRTSHPTDVLAVTVHGPSGALDLMVPSAVPVTEIAREYAAQAGLGSIPLLYSRTGDVLLASSTLAELGLETGSILVAATGVHRPSSRPSSTTVHPNEAAGPSPIAMLWCAVSAVVAALAGWLGAHATGRDHDLAVALLFAAAVLGVAPVGRYAEARAIAVPAFAAAAGFAAFWDPDAQRLPMTIGVAALLAAVGAAAARMAAREAEAELKVVMIAGGLVFGATGLVTLIGWAPRADWSILLLGALLAARFVPIVAVDVPDQYLVDFERLAVTAWSARDRGPRRRVRSIVPEAAVAAVAARGSRVVTAASASVLVVAALSAPLLLATAYLPVDRIGARLLVFLVGAGLLLAARNYRHAAARALLRCAGVACWVSLSVYYAARLDEGQLMSCALGAIAVGLIAVLAAIATGRGWRSAWWSRRAELAEALCGSSAIALVLVASGFFRHLWEITS